jgi:hypothetical protein
MQHVRFIVCVTVLAAACAAGDPADPEAELPDAGETEGPEPDAAAPTPPAPRLDAAAPQTLPRDAATTPVTTPDAGAAEAGPPAPTETENASYTCTHIIGINATAEWYNRGFEQLVDNSKWQLVRVHSGFVQLWAQPNAAAWSTGPTSACAQSSKNPDRVLFVGLNFEYDKLEQWVPNLQAVVKNLQARFPGVKRIELGTFVRAPGNKPCPQRAAYRSTITPAQDMANEMVAAENPTLVRVMPKFEAKTCSEFSGNPPHPSTSGGMAWAKMIAEHYGLGK